MIELVICDDHSLVRASLRKAMAADGQFRVVGEAASAPVLLSLLADLQPNTVILLDLNLSRAGLMDGLALVTRLKHGAASFPVLVVSMHDEADVVRAALAAGADGYLTKDSSLEVLREAIHHVHQGRGYMDPALVRVLSRSNQAASAEHALGRLTARESEIVRLLSGGSRVIDIARQLGLSIKTVSTHKMRAMDKLGVQNNADLVRVMDELDPGSRPGELQPSTGPRASPH